MFMTFVSCKFFSAKFPHIYMYTNIVMVISYNQRVFTTAYFLPFTIVKCLKCERNRNKRFLKILVSEKCSVSTFNIGKFIKWGVQRIYID
jgi:hypothetical protein